MLSLLIKHLVTMLCNEWILITTLTDLQYVPGVPTCALAKTVKFLTSIWDMYGSNFGCDPNYTDWILFVVVLSPFRWISGLCLRAGHDSILPTSLFTSDPTFEVHRMPLKSQKKKKISKTKAGLTVMLLLLCAPVFVLHLNDRVSISC
jgi:hypothetical protein